ncbi:MAG: hypothetical protein HC809_03980 [Gammaproteobacteria bacterium]|nr:hypothetical protein [Gammaproteobacteria bacterium]
MRPRRASGSSSGSVWLRGEAFIEALENRLGLPPVSAVPGESLIAYRDCLEALDSPSRFYHVSFAVDPIAVTRTLLEWRERFYLYGWAGTVERSASLRLRDLADIERQASAKVPLCLGQRIERVRGALQAGLACGVTHVTLDQPLVRAPGAWRKLLECFEHSDTAAVPAPRGRYRSR